MSLLNAYIKRQSGERERLTNAAMPVVQSCLQAMLLCQQVNGISRPIVLLSALYPICPLLQHIGLALDLPKALRLHPPAKFFPSFDNDEIVNAILMKRLGGHNACNTSPKYDDPMPCRIWV